MTYEKIFYLLSESVGVYFSLTAVVDKVCADF